MIAMKESYRFNRNTFLYPFVILFLGLVLTHSSCKDPDVVDPIVDGEISLKQVLFALGGENTLNEITHMHYEVDGLTYEHEEEEPSRNNPILVNSYKAIVSTEINNRKLRTVYSKFDVNYPIAFSSPRFTTIINDKNGTISGQYSVPSYFFGQVQPVAITPSRIEANLKNYLMSNPIELIRAYLKENPDLKKLTQNDILEIPTWVEDIKIELQIDEQTHLPSSARVIDADFLHGDVFLEVQFMEWKKCGSIMHPMKLEYFFNEKKVKEENLSNVRTVNLPEVTFTPEDVQNLIAYDEALGLRGFYASQWYSRMADLGIPIDLPLLGGFVMLDQWTALGIPDQTINNEVRIIGRPDLSYWGVAIKTSEGVLLVDAPLNQEWCRSIMDVTTTEAFPNTDITGVVVTHDHFDHYGGIREMAAQAGKVYINGTGTDKLKDILNSDHKLIPDNLQGGAAGVDIIAVEGVTFLDEGKVEIHSVNMNGSDDNPHSDNMLIVYVPEYELLVQADLMNFGGLLAVYAGQGAFPMAEQTQETFKERAKFLLNYIAKKELKVSKIVGIHGGLGSIEQLAFVAQ